MKSTEVEEELQYNEVPHSGTREWQNPNMVLVNGKRFNKSSILSYREW